MSLQTATRGAAHAAIADLDVGVIYTHERRYMPQLLDTMRPAAGDLQLRLILVDNASAGGCDEWRRAFPRTTVRTNAARLGYGANLNRILEAATAPYVLLMNTDMAFDPAEPCLEKMARFMDAHPDCGVSVCRIYHPDGGYGYPARRFQTPRIIAARRLGLDTVFSHSIEHYLYGDRDRESSFDCDWISGCFMFLRREAALEIGPFDLRFAKYFEDVDYCARMAQAGWRVMFNGDTYCYHHEQRASRRLLSIDAWLHVRSYFRWLAKWGATPPKPGVPRDARKSAQYPVLQKLVSSDT
jgi:GT2 family glycosyltransferase